MKKLVRFGVSIEKDLLMRFDRLIKERRYSNRSEAFRDLIRRELIKKQWKEGKQVAGAITFVFNHHRREILDKIIHAQHDFQKLIISTQHVHLDHDNCLEIIALKGSAKEAEALADAIRAIKGVMHGELSMSSTGAGIS
ncbi:nickel-responsive transcriptional regulator NikR [Candidatus Omnitrophota bacterium]